VDCYGAYVLAERPADSPIQGPPLRDILPGISCPVLGLFGDEDQFPTPAEVDELTKLLIELGKDFEVHSYPDAGHGFFGVDRAMYRVAAANDGWERIAEFFGRHLGTEV
jgi:carboxymethylenebutenolidase